MFKGIAAARHFSSNPAALTFCKGLVHMKRISPDLGFDSFISESLDDLIPVIYKYAEGLPGMYAFGSHLWKNDSRFVSEQGIVVLC